MTELFKQFVTEVNDNLISAVDHYVDSNYTIVVERGGIVLNFTSEDLNKYYQVYVYGKRSYYQTVLRTVSALNKVIVKYFSEFFELFEIE